MNKAELVDAVSNKTGFTKADVERVLNATLGAIAKGAKKEPVQLVGFGTFRTAARKARMGVNPATGKKIKIPAKKVFVFKASKNPKF